MINQNFVILGALLSLIGGGKYIYDTIRGRTRPNRVTWFMWALAPLIAFAAELKQGVGLLALMTFIVGFNPLMVFIASFVNKQAVWNLTRFDFLCGGLSLLGLILWLFTRQGNYAIIFSIIADLFASIPTIRKSFVAPQTETVLIYIMGGINAIITLLAIKYWSLAVAAFPLYILAINIVFTSLIFIRRRSV